MKIMFISLGCDKNLVDTEMMLGMLAEKGYQFTDDEQEAEIVVVNTCCFIGDAKEESINTLIEIGQLKETANVKMLIAAGCLAQRYRKEIREQIPEVDVIIGTMAIDKIVEAVEEYQTKQYTTFVEDIDRTPVSGKKRVVTTGGHYAYMKIAEGCDKRCSYCIIPKVRGSYRSIPMETLLKEANTLVEQGVKELILVAQETTLYGTDLYGKKSLPELLRKLSEIRGLYWIRILYCYPEEITEELIDTIAELPKVCHYLDIPIQHASDKILKRMGRRTNQQQLKDKIAMIRSKIPDMCLRTTLITGFPGESQEDHEQSMAFVDEMEFDRLGVFTYSAEEDTPAAEMPDQVDEGERQRRADIITSEQEIRMGEYYAGMVGNTYEVVCEGFDRYSDMYFGRSMHFAPEIDGMIYFTSAKDKSSLTIGDFVNVKITDVLENNLLGERV